MKRDYCCYCKEDLTDDNAVGGSFICKECQKLIYKEIEGRNGCHLAIFLTCAAVNLPCIPKLGKGVEETAEPWETYVDKLASNNKLEKNTQYTTFFDGITDIRKVFGKEMTEKDFAKYLDYEQKRFAVLAGTPEQRERWGTGELCKGLPLTDELYCELDEQREIWLGRYKGQIVTPPLEQSIITICKRNKVADFLIETGAYNDAAKVQKMVDELMASEQMRKKDEKPIEQFRLDAWIDAFEKSGLMKNNDFLTFPEMEESLMKIMRGRGYNQTLDVVHQLEKNIINNQRRNDDKQTIFELPENMKVVDELHEFVEEETAEEKHRKKYAKLPKVRIEGE